MMTSAGDLNGDGCVDMLVATETTLAGGQSARVVRVFSPCDGRSTFTFNEGDSAAGYGASLESLGDLNGDGVAEIAIGAPERSSPGMVPTGAVFVYDGATKSRLVTILGPPPTEPQHSAFGAVITCVSDLNSDTVNDFLVGAPLAPNGAGVHTGSVTAFSGVTFAPLFEVFGVEDSELFGTTIVSLPDLNSDGVGDFAVGSPQAGSEDGAVTVASGLDGTVVRRIAGAAGSLTGSALAAVDDLDGDALADIAVGAPQDQLSGSAHIMSSASGAILESYHGTLFSERFGASLASADMNGDGALDLAIGAPRADSPLALFTGKLVVFSVADSTLLLEVPGWAVFGAFGEIVRPLGDLNGDGRGDVGICSQFAPDDRASYEPGFAGAFGLVDVALVPGWLGGTTRRIDLLGSSPTVCLQIELGGTGIAPADIDLRTLRVHPLKAKVNDLFSLPASSPSELFDVCFRRVDFRNYWLGLSSDVRSGPLIAEADLEDGRRLVSVLEGSIESASSSGALVTPNPTRGGGTLSYLAAGAGEAIIRVYNVRGSMIGTPVRISHGGPGYQDVPLALWLASPAPAPSDIYFYVIELPGQVLRGRFVVAR